MPVGTLYDWRCKGYGPKGKRVGCFLRYEDRRSASPILVHRSGHAADQLSCAPGRTRTCDLEIRRLLLYPAELRGPMQSVRTAMTRVAGRSWPVRHRLANRSRCGGVRSQLVPCARSGRRTADEPTHDRCIPIPAATRERVDQSAVCRRSGRGDSPRRGSGPRRRTGCPAHRYRAIFTVFAGMHVHRFESVPVTLLVRLPGQCDNPTMWAVKFGQGGLRGVRSTPSRLSARRA